jgi:hypothetical protein
MVPKIRNCGPPFPLNVVAGRVSDFDFCSRNETQAALERFESRFDEKREISHV